MRLNNYKSADKSFKTKKRETQNLFHGHYMQDDHEGKDDWQSTLIYQCITNAELTKRKVYWQHRLKTFPLNGLNEREESCFTFCFINSSSISVVLAFCIIMIITIIFITTIIIIITLLLLF